MKGSYDDIINLPHHVSSSRPQMSREKRAAQFAPFAALSGYDSAIKETARLTDKKVELGESDIEELNMKLNILDNKIGDHPEVTITFFQEDDKKKGGAYVTATGTVKRIDDYEGVVVFLNGEKITIADFFEIESVLFEGMI
jgi:hypothetical protein